MCCSALTYTYVAVMDYRPHKVSSEGDLYHPSMKDLILFPADMQTLMHGAPDA